MKKSIFGLALCISIAALLSACGGGGVSSPAQQGLPDPNGPLASAIIGSSGGTIVVQSGPYKGCEISIPSAAVQDGTLVSIFATDVFPISSAGIERLGEPIRFTAIRSNGQAYGTFENGRSVSIKIPLDSSMVSANGGSLATASILSVGEGGETPEAHTLVKVLGNELAETTTDHLTVFQSSRPLAGSTPTAISNSSPQSADFNGGATISLQGFGFVNPLSATINGVAIADAFATSSTTITGTLPAGNPGPATISITTPIGNAVYSGFDYSGQKALQADTIVPSIGALTGVNFTLTGEGFSYGPTSVTIGGVAVGNVVVVSDTVLTGTLPDSLVSGNVDVVVTNTLGSELVANGFTYEYSDNDLLRPTSYDLTGANDAGTFFPTLDGAYWIACTSSEDQATFPIENAVLQVDTANGSIRIETYQGALLYERAWAGEGQLNTTFFGVSFFDDATSSFSLTFDSLNGSIEINVRDQSISAQYDNHYKQVGAAGIAAIQPYVGSYDGIRDGANVSFTLFANGDLTYSINGAPSVTKVWDSNYDYVQSRDGRNVLDNDATPMPMGESDTVWIVWESVPGPIDFVWLGFNSKLDDLWVRGLFDGITFAGADFAEEEAASVLIGGIPDFFALHAGTYTSQAGAASTSGTTAMLPIAIADDELVPFTIHPDGRVIVKGQTYTWTGSGDSYLFGSNEFDGRPNSLYIRNTDDWITLQVDSNFKDQFRVTITFLSKRGSVSNQYDSRVFSRPTN